MGRILSSLNLAIMQTEADARRLRALGMNAAHTFVSGSLKFDAGTMPQTESADSLRAGFRERFRLTDGSPLILAASTHAPEERIILAAFKDVVSKSGLSPRLLIAPRHPERFAEVAALIGSSGFSWTRRTAPPTMSDAQCEVILLDSIGELPLLYSLAAIVFVGGSIAKSGGHNILEPAAIGACVFTGAHTQNFQAIVETFVNAGAVVQLQPMSDSEATMKMAKVILELLADPARRASLGKLAQGLVNENRGATERTLNLLRPILSNHASGMKRSRSLRATRAPVA